MSGPRHACLSGRRSHYQKAKWQTRLKPPDVNRSFGIAFITFACSSPLAAFLCSKTRTVRPVSCIAYLAFIGFYSEFSLLLHRAHCASHRKEGLTVSVGYGCVLTVTSRNGYLFTFLWTRCLGFRSHSRDRTRVLPLCADDGSAVDNPAGADVGQIRVYIPAVGGAKK